MGDAMLDRVEGLRAQVATHKRAINHHRRGLHEAKTQLVILEEECRKRGIQLVIVPSGVGVIHGH